jgi:hypothetical protein
MISANSENEQATVITLTETELEGIYGGWGHHYYEERFNDCGDNERFSFRGDFCGGDRFDFRGGDRFSFRGDDNCW